MVHAAEGILNKIISLIKNFFLLFLTSDIGASKSISWEMH